jgi:hypothetical protein
VWRKLRIPEHGDATIAANFCGRLEIEGQTPSSLLNGLVVLSHLSCRAFVRHQATVREITIPPARLVDRVFLEASFPETFRDTSRKTRTFGWLIPEQDSVVHCNTIETPRRSACTGR